MKWWSVVLVLPWEGDYWGAPRRAKGAASEGEEVAGVVEAAVGEVALHKRGGIIDLR